MAGKRGNGEGTVFYNATRNRWEAHYVVGTDGTGKLIRRKVTGKTRKLVTERLADAKKASAQGEQRARPDTHVARILDEYLGTLPGTVALQTEANYRDVVRLYIRPYLGRKKLATMTARDVAAWLRELETKGLSAKTRRLARAVLRRALRYAEREGLVARNVAAIAEGPKVPAREGRTMTVDQAHEFLDAAREHRQGCAWVVALYTGLRRGELLGLGWDDLDLDADRPTLTVHRNLQRVTISPEQQEADGARTRLVVTETKTRTSRRTVMLAAPVVAALRAYRAAQNRDQLQCIEWHDAPYGVDFVFRTAFGAPIDPANFTAWTYSVSTAAGIGKWSPHALRHTAASLLIAEGVPLKVVSEMLGHSSIRETADIYAHLFDEGRAVAADAMERALSR